MKQQGNPTAKSSNDYSDHLKFFKNFLYKKGFLNYIESFNDINIAKFSDDDIDINCLLINQYPINLVIEIKNMVLTHIWVRVHGKTYISIYDRDKQVSFIDITRVFFEKCSSGKRKEAPIHIFKFYLDYVKAAAGKNYDIALIQQINIKADLHSLTYKLDGLYKTKNYKKLMKEYRDVII